MQPQNNRKPYKVPGTRTKCPRCKGKLFYVLNNPDSIECHKCGANLTKPAVPQQQQQPQYPIQQRVIPPQEGRLL